MVELEKDLKNCWASKGGSIPFNPSPSPVPKLAAPRLGWAHNASVPLTKLL